MLHSNEGNIEAYCLIHWHGRWHLFSDTFHHRGWALLCIYCAKFSKSLEQKCLKLCPLLERKIWEPASPHLLLREAWLEQALLLMPNTLNVSKFSSSLELITWSAQQHKGKDIAPGYLYSFIRDSATDFDRNFQNQRLTRLPKCFDTARELEA